MIEPMKADRWFAVLEVADSTCTHQGCDGEVAAMETTFTELESGRIVYSLAWACADHAGKQADPQWLWPTCRVGPTWAVATSCGAVTSHVAIGGVSDETRGRWLRAASVCPRHANELAKLVKPARRTPVETSGEQ